MPRIWGARTGDERRAERRERIIRAAIKVYGQHGYHRASVKAICLEAGLTERYFYESFVNNEDLLRHCFLAVELDLIRRNPDTARVFLIEMASVSPAAEALVLESLDRFGSLLMEVLGADARFASRPSPLLLRGIVGGGLYLVRNRNDRRARPAVLHGADHVGAAVAILKPITAASLSFREIS